MFGDTFTPEYIESLIQETNAFYGGKNIDVDNVVFVHGSDDPWHPMGRLTDVNENSPAFVIDGKKINHLMVEQSYKYLRVDFGLSGPGNVQII